MTKKGRGRREKEKKDNVLNNRTAQNMTSRNLAFKFVSIKAIRQFVHFNH